MLVVTAINSLSFFSSVCVCVRQREERETERKREWAEEA